MEKVTVCDHCLKASCWAGAYYCEHYTIAGTVALPVYTLEWLNLESKDHWRKDEERQEEGGTMQKAFLVTTGAYSDYSVEAVFSTKARAEEYAKHVAYAVVEDSLLDPAIPQTPQGRSLYFVAMRRDGTVFYHVHKDSECAIAKDKFTPFVYRNVTYTDVMGCYIWARDYTHAIKIMNEKRLGWLAARKPWGEQ